MLFYTTTMNNTECTKCPVATGTHKPADAVHQIAEPPAQQPEPIGDVFCKGSLALGSGCMRCGRCAVDLAARVKELEKSESNLIAQRDHCEEVIDRMADAVLGKDRHEWTSAYDYMDAAQEVEDRVAELESQLEAVGAGGVEALRGNIAKSLGAFDHANSLRSMQSETGAICTSDAMAAAPQAVQATTESVLIDGVAYEVHAEVAAELLRLHIELQQSPAHPAEAVPEDGFELWWADHMPKSTQTEAWSAWVALHQSTHPTQQGMDALNQAIEAMQLALSSHGVQLLSYPPQDAWSSRRVDEKLRTAISALAAQAKQGEQP